MSDDLDVLKQLQVVDGKLYYLRREMQELPKGLDQSQAKVTEQEVRLKTAEEQFKACQLSQKAKEGELQTREENIKKLQGQLFQVKTNKEYTAIQHEIDSLKTDNSLLEEEIIKLLDVVDEANRGRQEEQQRLAEVQKWLDSERARIEKAIADKRGQMEQLEEERGRMAPTVSARTLDWYERVLTNRDGLALVPLENESCGGCHRRLPPQVINEVYLRSKLVSCENCNRILYATEAPHPSEG